MVKSVITPKTAALFVAGTFLLLLELYIQFRGATAGDRNFLLYFARRVLEGNRAYIDAVDVNPPLILWVNELPAWLARLLGLSGNAIQVSLVFALAAVSATLGTKLVAAHPAFKGDRVRQAQFGLLLMAVYSVTSPAYFGDRDHLILICVVPYALRFMPSLRRCDYPLNLRLLVGLLAALGFFLKPHITFVFALSQLFCILRPVTRFICISLENIIIYAFGTLYLLATWFYAPEYIHIILPMSLATYSAFSRKLQGFISFGSVALIIAAVAFVDFRPGHKTPYRRDIPYLIAVCLGFLIHALLNNGWGYTYNPLICFLLITCAWVGWEFGFLRREAKQNGMPERQFTFGARACATVLLANMLLPAALSFYILSNYCPNQIACYASGRELINEVKKVHSFGVVSLDFDPWPRISDAAHTELVTRFNGLWMLPAFIKGGNAFEADHRKILQYVAGALADDLRNKKPELVIVDGMDTQSSPAKPVDLLVYFTPFPDFKDAWAHYTLERTVGNCYPTNPPSAQTHCDYMLFRRDNH